LPERTFCYKAPADAPLPAPGPLERGEGPVFGCFNNPHKIGPDVIRLWASIVNAVPGARLRLKARQFLDEGAAARYRQRFVEAGVSADRIEIEGRRTFQEGFAEYSTIDVALDPFPYHGTTSTCEALWMATPVVVLPGKTCVSRVGPSLLARVGLDDLVARDEDHYRAIAVTLINDPARLAELRRTLRARMANSSLCDGVRFARQMEVAYREQWRAFCAIVAAMPDGGAPRATDA
jgi:protein O-GlcNAc transferase